MDRAEWHEQRLEWHNRPLAAFLMRAVSLGRTGFHVPRIGYVVNSPDLACKLLAHPAFRSTGHGSMDDIITGLVGPNALLNMDGAYHREMRSHLMDVFSRRNVEGLVEGAGDGLLCAMREELLAGKTVDIAHYSQRLVGRAICQAIGLRVESEEVYGEVAALASSITSMLGLDRLKPSEDDVKKASVFYRQLLSRAQETYGKGQAVEHSTVISNLQAAGLSFEQASGVLAVVLLAGTETVSVALPRITALLVDTGQLRRLSEKRELLPNAIVEGLRVVVPSHVILRSVGEDATLDGMEFRKGERVIVIISNALKQSKYFPRPGRFDIEREVESRFKHLCFGAGPHFCLGFALAHREIAAFIEALLDLPGEARVVSRKYPRNMNFPSYVSLKVRVEGLGPKTKDEGRKKTVAG